MHLPVDHGITWHLPALDHLRLMRANYVQHSFKPHAHEYFVLGIIEAGVQSFTHERQHHITTPGQLIVINPGEMHTGEAAINAGFMYRALYPSVATMERMVREFQLEAQIPLNFTSGTIKDQQLYGWIQRLHRLSESDHSALELEDGLTRFFVELIRRHATTRLNLPDYTEAHQAVSRVRDYLEAHYAENVTLSELAAQVHISPYHLARLFRQHTGIPPHKYLENVRIGHAERLLVAGMPIAEIAYATGFSSQSHLTRTFKRFIGTTPGAYLSKNV